MTISEGLCRVLCGAPIRCTLPNSVLTEHPTETAIEASRTDSYLPAGFREVVSVSGPKAAGAQPGGTRVRQANRIRAACRAAGDPRQHPFRVHPSGRCDRVPGFPPGLRLRRPFRPQNIRCLRAQPIGEAISAVLRGSLAPLRSNSRKEDFGQITHGAIGR